MTRMVWVLLEGMAAVAARTVTAVGREPWACIRLWEGVAAPDEVPDSTTTEPRAEPELTMPLVVGRTVMVVLPPLATELTLEDTSMTVVGALVAMLLVMPAAVATVASGAGRAAAEVVVVVVVAAAVLSLSRLLMATAEPRSVN